jgi:dTMP kinase
MQPFITFEGIEGCGKTTQMKMAGEVFRNRHLPCLLTEEPGGTPLGRRIRQMLLQRGQESICSEAEILLFGAARAQHVRETILPALKKGEWVLCDRFTDATIAYQGFGRGLDLECIHRINAFASPLSPALTFLFDLPVETGLQRALDRIGRAGGKAPEDRFEHEARAFHERIRNGYLTLAREDPERFRVIDAARDIFTIHKEVSVQLAKFIKGSTDVLP